MKIFELYYFLYNCVFKEEEGGVPIRLWFPLRPAHYLTAGPLFRLCGLIHVCEKALLVSQTLNRALALITANLRPLPVINDPATDSHHRRAQKKKEREKKRLG